MADRFVVSAAPPDGDSRHAPTPPVVHEGSSQQHSSAPSSSPGASSRAALARMQRRRSAALAQETISHERGLVGGRWVTDTQALRHVETRRREHIHRRAPQQTARMHMYAAHEADNTGLELEAHEVADRVTQDDLANAVDVQTRRKQMSLTLNSLGGPYRIDFSRNGSHMLLTGQRGHVANLRWSAGPTLQSEVQLNERVHDATFLLDFTMSALAQRTHVYLYGKDGSEMHVLPSMTHMTRLAFLPRHLLLAASSSRYSVLNYVDVSTGQSLGHKSPAVMVNPASALVANAANGVVVSGDVRGVVKFWSPSVVDPLLQLKAHGGVVSEVRFHPNGRYFITVGSADHKVKVWDCRTLRTLEEYGMRYMVDSVDISHRGLVALGGGCQVQIWSHVFTAAAGESSSGYMKFPLGYGHAVERVRFCPFEDVLGVGHGRGVCTLLVPGAGEANPDVYAANPYETERQRGERVVTQLLDKLPPDTISMDVQVAGVNEARLAAYRANLQLNRKARSIREKKERRAAQAADGSNPANPGSSASNQLLSSSSAAHAVPDEDELDEELGYKEQPRTRVLKTRQERAKEAKSHKWDKKDSADKVRSKQTMRQSRMVQKSRAQRAHERRHGAYDADDLAEEEATALARERVAAERTLKRRRVERAAAADDIRLGMRDGAPVSLARAPRRTRRGDDAEEEAEGDDGNVAQNAAFRRWMR